MLHCLLSDVRNCKCFTRACLAVSKERNNSLLEKSGQKRLDLELVHMCGGFLVPVSVVEHEFVVLDVLGDAIHLYFWLVNLDTRVEAAHCVDFAQRYLLFE